MSSSSDAPIFDPFALAFGTHEPGDGQRWSTWGAITPSERGPRPYPDWVVTSAAAFDTELGIVKTGKEADVFLIERAVPGGQAVVLAAKRYRGPETSDFHRSSRYTEGRGMRNTRDSRAVARGSSYGRSVSAIRWAYAEFEALRTLYARGLPVPYPVQVNGSELLMEFIGDGQTAAPRLAAQRGTASELYPLYAQVVEIMRGLARAGVAHGDLSPYNLLVHHGRVVVIDLPQLVEVVSNPDGMDMLYRDCVNVCTWFSRQGLGCDPDAVFAELVAEMF
ncbi:serine/threonine protein kinase [Microterricola viridarii]|uniref:non-specific serine/threonine protein kinase n=1 Tax=Microterricola viridarii TaxID=412690 RepID=A0A109QY14_9MICO|nr:serine/threonine protein kinase [Microterricola viridarii]